MGSVHSNFTQDISLRWIASWKPKPVPDEQCFEAIKAGIEAMPPDAKMFLNGGE